MTRKKMGKAKLDMYLKCLVWIAEYDDTDWLNEPGVPDPSVTASMIAHVFDIDDLKVKNDLKRALHHVELAEKNKKSGEVGT